MRRALPLSHTTIIYENTESNPDSVCFYYSSLDLLNFENFTPNLLPLPFSCFFSQQPVTREDDSTPQHLFSSPRHFGKRLSAISSCESLSQWRYYRLVTMALLTRQKWQFICTYFLIENNHHWCTIRYIAKQYKHVGLSFTCHNKAAVLNLFTVATPW